MTKFMVTATQIINYEISVEAESIDQAHRIAEALTPEDFYTTGGEFGVDYIAFDGDAE